MTDADEATSSSPILRAKLRTPVPPAHYVRRARLIHFLDDLVGAPVVVVVAPAGAGKTCLLAGWIAERTGPSAWLSLDDSDRDDVLFWTGIIASLEALNPGCGAQARALLRRRATMVEVVGTLLNDLEEAPAASVRAASVLVIDDVHCLSDAEATADALGMFLRHLPAWLHVVLVSRRVPHLPLDRLRARGQLGEARFAELRFSDAEARELLSRLAPSMPEAEVQAIAGHVDGLAVGLQLAALKARSVSARRGGEPATGADDLVHEFVLHEVLASESPELIDVLLDVSVVGRVNAGLARALTGREDADQLLERSEARGLFVSAVDPRGWFELHSLARAVFVAELGRRAPSRVVEQHARAARWFEGADEIPLALAHFLLAGQPAEALRLLSAKQAELYDAGLESVIVRTIDGIPQAVVSASLESMLAFARCNLLINRRRFLDTVEQATFWASQSAELEPLMRARLAIVQAMAAVVDGDVTACGDRGREALSLFGDTAWRDPFGRFAWNMVAHEVALAERWDDADPEVRAARFSLNREPERRVAFEGTGALGAALAGRPLDALKSVAGVRGLANVVDKTIMRAELAAAEAVAHRELGDRVRGMAELRAIAEAPAETMLFCRILALTELGQAYLDEGDIEEAQRAHERAQRLHDNERFGPIGRDWIGRLGVRLALDVGALEVAKERAGQLVDPFWSAVTSARIDLATGDRAPASDTLRAATPRCDRHAVILGLLRARAVDDSAEAAQIAAAAVERAAARGMLQTVASEGHEALDLVERVAWSAPDAWLERLRRLPVGVVAPAAADSIVLIDPLTDRELEVLRFLPSRLTVREIADELFVSVNTLKFHLRLIYRKLDVNSRAEAAERARHLPSARAHTR
jgi:LuxR family transcriptional regulator, maltose regulon positive regulatory protein